MRLAVGPIDFRYTGAWKFHLPVRQRTGVLVGMDFLGCYTEGNNRCALKTPAYGIGGMTVAGCVSACNTAGYSMAGVEYAEECYCGDSISNSATTALGGISDCSMTCQGNNSEYCGAGN